jgi:hypothetical protein
MGSYVFDTDDIFRVRGGMIGAVEDCRIFVFHYPREAESAETYEDATARLSGNSRFKDRLRKGTRYSMVGRNDEYAVIDRAGRFIAIVIGKNPDNVKTIADRFAEKLKSE